MGVVLEKNLRVIENICSFVKEHGRCPHHNTTDVVEKKMYHALQSLRQAKHPCPSNVGVTKKFYPQYQEKANQLGLPNLFDKKTYYRHDAIREIKEICAFFKANGRPPSYDTYDKDEELLSNILKSLKSAKANKLGRFLPTYQQIAEEEGCPHIFDPIRTKKNQIRKDLDIIEKICRFHQVHGVFPTSYRSEKAVRMLDGRLQLFRRMKLRKLPRPLPQSYQKKATELGYPNLFNSITMDKKRKNIVTGIKKICAFHKKHGYFPSRQTEGEAVLGNLLINLRQGKRKTENKDRKTDLIFATIYQETAEKCGYPDLFELRHTQPSRKYSYNTLVKRHNQARSCYTRVRLKAVACHRKEYDPDDFNRLR